MRRALHALSDDDRCRRCAHRRDLHPIGNPYPALPSSDIYDGRCHHFGAAGRCVCHVFVEPAPGVLPP